MARRLHQTMADYVVIAISPGLIMTLVGSLVFFLITVFYQGEYPARLHWVMACFVFAAVLIGRISIEEGLERAMPFGVALAVVVGIAANKFIEFRGDWIGQFGWILNWGLIGLTWWCAHKLTWDCTMIDDTQDASGEGLLQVAGLERPADQRNDTGRPAGQNLEGTTSRELPAGWWQRYLEHQRRPHAPGVWVIYFSLAALPLFGIGQWFIPVSETGARRFAFWLLALYVASGLGLLLTTSFLGLRRYLRQRRVEMPTAMANLWLGMGAVVVVSLLIVAALLPRPSAEYAIAELPFSVGSPNSGSSRFAPVSREGVKDDQPGPAPAQRPDEKPADGNAQGTGEPSDKSSQSGQSATSGGSQSKGDQSGQRSPSDQANSSDDSQAKSGQSQQEQSPANNNSTDDTRAKLHERLDRFRRDKAGQSEQQPAEQKGEEKAAEKAAEKTDNPPPDQHAGNQPSSERPPQQDEQAQQDKQQRPKDKEEPPDETHKRENAAGSRAPEAPSSFKMPEVAEVPVGFLAQVLRWAFYAGFVLAVLYFLWRFRAEALAAVRDFLAGLRDFWDGLFGRRRPRGLAREVPAEIKIPPAPFATYADPFSSGVAGRYPMEELIRYSFEAFEAWAREHGCPREPDDTPHELARDVGKLNSYMAADARHLAELYARAAYAQGEVPDTAREQLRQLWHTMRQSSGARP